MNTQAPDKAEALAEALAAVDRAINDLERADKDRAKAMVAINMANKDLERAEKDSDMAWLAIATAQKARDKASDDVTKLNRNQYQEVKP